jgi:hypothetical protein
MVYCQQIRVNGDWVFPSGKDADCIILYPMAGLESKVYLDVGNDSLPGWEWGTTAENARERTPDFSDKINSILSAGCECEGCVKVGEKGKENCTIPFRFHSNDTGLMYVDDIDVLHYSYETVMSVRENKSFVISLGCEWTIDYNRSDTVHTATLMIPENYNGQRRCNYTESSHNPPMGDATNDAVYRLLRRLDSSPDNGVIDDEWNFNHTTMFFETDSYMGVQYLWGPTVINLIVWI